MLDICIYHTVYICKWYIKYEYASISDCVVQFRLQSWTLKRRHRAFRHVPAENPGRVFPRMRVWTRHRLMPKPHPASPMPGSESLGWCLKKPPQTNEPTPWKINMDHNHAGLVQIIFLSKWVMAVGSILIFQAVFSEKGNHQHTYCTIIHLHRFDSPIVFAKV